MNNTWQLLKTKPVPQNPLGHTEERLYKLPEGGYFHAYATVTKKQNTVDPTSGLHISHESAQEYWGVE
jgi:hypothetical protein